MYLFFFSCVAKTPQSDTPIPSSTTTSALTLVEQLQAHDAVSCSDLNFRTEKPWKELEEMLDIPRPPWIAMRAATCMIKDYPKQSRVSFHSWLTTPTQKGLAILLCSSFDMLPVEQQNELVDIALAGVHAQSCAQRLKNSSSPEIQQKATPFIP